MPKSRKRSRVTSEDIADNLGKLSICAALLNQIFLTVSPQEILTMQEKQYCVDLDNFIRTALQTEAYEEPEFAAALDSMQADLTKLAILQQTRLAEIAQSVASAATEEIQQRLQELLTLQREIISAAKKSKISKESFIVLMRRVNNALTEGDYVHRKFSEVLIDLREHLRNYLQTNRKPHPPKDLYEECLYFLDVIAASNMKDSLSAEEKKTCHHILVMLRQAGKTYEYKQISFQHKLQEAYPILITIACNQQMRLNRIAQERSENIMITVKSRLQNVISLFQKVSSAATTINPGIVIQLMQNINDSLLKGEFAHPKFKAKLIELQTTFRRTKKAIKFNEDKIVEETTYAKVPHKTTGYFASLRHSHTGSQTNKENTPRNNRRTFT